MPDSDAQSVDGTCRFRCRRCRSPSILYTLLKRIQTCREENGRSADRFMLSPKPYSTEFLNKIKCHIICVVLVGWSDRCLCARHGSAVWTMKMPLDAIRVSSLRWTLSEALHIYSLLERFSIEPEICACIRA